MRKMDDRECRELIPSPEFHAFIFKPKYTPGWQAFSGLCPPNANPPTCSLQDVHACQIMPVCAQPVNPRKA
jgi:hypothetical protein